MKEKDIGDLIDAIDNGPPLNNTWETGFLDSVMKQREKGKDLSEKQIAVLEKIAERIGV